jgi:DNA-binding NarL/FixJ family response regulator
MIRVLVVDDHEVVRRGLEQLLATVDDVELVAMARDGVEAVALVAQHHPDVVLMDLSMPTMDGVEATRRIVAADPAARVVVLTSFSEQARVLEALAAGAQGYLLKHAEAEELVAAVRTAMAGGAPLDPTAARALLDASRRRSSERALTDREEEILRLVTDGLANKQIARHLGISERTVKAHLTQVFQRIGVRDRTQAALWAREHLG